VHGFHLNQCHLNEKGLRAGIARDPVLPAWTAQLGKKKKRSRRAPERSIAEWTARLTEAPAGELLSAALQSLPDAASLEETTLRLVVKLPEGLRAEVTFARLKRPHRRKKNPTETHWFWTPASAVLVEE
jgi:hypothetical protein